MTKPQASRRRVAGWRTVLAFALLAAVAGVLPEGLVHGAPTSVPFPTVAYLRAYRASFRGPTRLAVDAVGNVYVADPDLGQVVVRAASGHIVSRSGPLGRPISVAVDGAGTIYVGDAATGSVTGYGADWHPLLQVGHGQGEFSQPSDLAVDTASGDLFVADSTAHVVKVYSAAGAFLRSFGGQGSGNGQFEYPAGVAVDAAARQVLVADQLNYRIQIFDVAGTFVSSFGSQGSAPGQFNLPQGVAIDGQGRVYVADSIEGRLEVLDRSGGFLGFIGDFGEAPGQLRIPAGMVIDPSNRLFIAAANNARLEVFGLDTYSDPETILPAVVHVEPEAIDRAAAGGSIVAYLEIPGYALDQVTPGSLAANGVSPSAAPTIGDHDGNGLPDLRVPFDRTALLATLPAAGPGTVSVSGLLGTKHIEGSATVEITICGPGTVCSLGAADPQCNEAVCLPAVGCSVQPKPDGTGCEDGNACTIDDTCNGGTCQGTVLNCDDGNVCTDDSCDPVSGCVHADHAGPCDDGNACTTGDTCSAGTCTGVPVTCNDGNPCTDDSCDPASGCVYRNNTLPCDDANPCTANDACGGGVCTGTPLSCDDGNPCTDDSCSPVSGCSHVPNTAPCDDGDPGTVQDTCDGAGRCLGHAVTGNYAVLSWPEDPRGHGTVSFTGQNLVHGDVCAEEIRLGPFTTIEGDSVAWATAGPAIAFRRGSRVAGNVVTGGGTLLGGSQAAISGQIAIGGTSSQLAACAAARHRATSRRTEWTALAPTAGLALGTIQVGPQAGRRVPSDGTLGSGQHVIQVGDLLLDTSSTLTLVGTADTTTVIVHVEGRMVLGSGARLAVEGVPAERVIFVTEGPVAVEPQASIAGSVFAAGRVRLGRASSVSGALLGTAVDLAPAATVDLQPFVGW